MELVEELVVLEGKQEEQGASLCLKQIFPGLVWYDEDFPSKKLSSMHVLHQS